jgi:hypothetical protein
MKDPTLILLAKEYRLSTTANISHTTSDEKINSMIEVFYKDPHTIESPVPGSVLVDIAYIEKFGTEDYKHKAIKFVFINILKIIMDYNKNREDTFDIKLVDEDGQNADKCPQTELHIPYMFHYSNYTFSVLE